MMSNAQFVSAMAVASGLNTLAVVVGILINVAKLKELRANVEVLSAHLDRRFDRICDRGAEPRRG
jgi:hypothetical protein